MTIQSRFTPSTDRRSVSCITSHGQVLNRKEVSLQETERGSETKSFYYTPDGSQHDSNCTTTSDLHIGQKRPYDTIKASGSDSHAFVELIPEKGAEPDWQTNQGCFAYLQGNYQHGKSQYLAKVRLVSDNRVGYVIGRHEQKCDIVIKDINVSREHCLVYVESGSNGERKGIRIYLECLSNWGVWVNGEYKSVGQRTMLRDGNTIGLYTRNHEPITFFTVRFPPTFEAFTCEDKYKLTAELGKGSYGTVYHAYPKGTETPVAIKVISKTLFNSKPKLLESIIQEMSIMMRMEKHPLLVQIKETFNEKRRIFLVLEFIRDGELFDCLSNNERFTENEARFVFWQLLNGIKYLHRIGVAHRDLKPENVLLSNKEHLHIKISDFGLAKKQSGQEFFGTQCGTPNYVAPEVLDPPEARAYTFQCDVWSLGVMLYIFLCGATPFSEDYAPPSMKAQIKMGKFEFFPPFWDIISNEAKDMIKALLTVDPNERATVDEALNMPWMKMEKNDLEQRKETLGREALDRIILLNDPTEIASTQV